MGREQRFADRRDRICSQKRECGEQQHEQERLLHAAILTVLELTGETRTRWGNKQCFEVYIRLRGTS